MLGADIEKTYTHTHHEKNHLYLQEASGPFQYKDAIPNQTGLLSTL